MDSLLIIFTSFKNDRGGSRFFSKKEFRFELKKHFPNRGNNFYSNLEELLTLFKVKIIQVHGYPTKKFIKYFFTNAKKARRELLESLDKMILRFTDVLSDIYKVKKVFSTWILSTFGDADFYETSINKYINIKSKADRIYLKMQLLEFFDLATFQTVGGTDPKIL